MVSGTKFSTIRAAVLLGVVAWCSVTYSSAAVAEEVRKAGPVRMALIVLESAKVPAEMNGKDFVALIKLAEQLGDYKLSLSDYEEFELDTVDEYIAVTGHHFDPVWEFIYDGPIEKGFRALLRRSDFSLLGVSTLSGSGIPKPSKNCP